MFFQCGKLGKVIGACLSHPHVFSLESRKRQPVGMPLNLQEPEALIDGIQVNLVVAGDLSHHLVQYFCSEMKMESRKAKWLAQVQTTS